VPEATDAVPQRRAERAEVSTSRDSRLLRKALWSFTSDGTGGQGWNGKEPGKARASGRLARGC
jgi:hypothetical protein